MAMATPKAKSALRLPLPSTKGGPRCRSPTANSPNGRSPSAVLLGRGGGEGKVTFQHILTRDNPGEMKDYYEMPWGSWLGKGAFGTVRRAVCKRTGLDRAIKSISVPNAEDRDRLEKEIAVQQRLHHPNVVRLFETFRAHKQLHLVMELCSGGELFNKISNEGEHGLPELEVASYTRQIVSAVCYLHSRFIAHRDLKPENFLLNGCENEHHAGILKLADFGNARNFVHGEAMTTPVGTAYYVAPEVLGGKYNELCDVWSIGVIAYVMLCGYPPFRGKTPGAILKKVIKGDIKYDYTDWRKVSRRAKSVVTSLLTFAPAHRPSARQVYAEPWLRATHLEKTPRIDNRVVERLLEYEEQAPSVLRQVAVTAVAQNLPDEELEAWRSAFQALDTDGDGVLSIEEIRRGLIRHGLTMPDALEDTMRILDSDGSGFVDYSEFLAATMDQRLCTRKEWCRAAFHTLDLDGDGAITPQELGQVLSGGDADKTPSHRVLLRMVEEADLNGDGVVDFEEFCWLMRPKGPRATVSRTAAPKVSQTPGSWAVDPRSPRKSVSRLLGWLGDLSAAICVCGPCSGTDAIAAAVAAVRKGDTSARQTLR